MGAQTTLALCILLAGSAQAAETAVCTAEVVVKPDHYDTNLNLLNDGWGQDGPIDQKLVDAGKLVKDIREGTKERFDYSDSPPSKGEALSGRMCALEYGVCEGWDCAGVRPIKKPGVNSTCDADQLKKYGSAIGAYASVGLAAAVGALVLLVVWYLLRCCLGWLGGARAHNVCCLKCKGACCCCKPHYSINVAENQVPSYSKCHLTTTQFGLLVVVVVAIVAAVPAFLGNGKVGPGLTDTIESSLYKLNSIVEDLKGTLSTMNTILESERGVSLGLDGNIDMASTEKQICDFQKTISDAKKEQEEFGDIGVQALTGFTLATTLLPIVMSVCLLAASCCKNKMGRCCSCSWACMALLPIIIIGLSAFLHTAITILTADLCYEFELQMYSAQKFPGAAQKVNFLPEDTDPCGEDGDFNSLNSEITENMDSGAAAGCDSIVKFCNEPPEPGAVDCSGAVKSEGGTGILTGTAPTYAHSCVFADVANFGDIPAQLKVKDIPSEAALTDFSTSPGDDTTKAGGLFTDADAKVCMTTWYQSLLDSFQGPSEEVARAKVVACAPLKTLRECGDSCANTKLKTESKSTDERLTDAGALATDLNVLFTEKVAPLLRCSFLSEMIEVMYVPLCVDALKGFTLMTIANAISGVALFLIFIAGVLLTKRVNKDNILHYQEEANLDDAYILKDAAAIVDGRETNYRGASACAPMQR